MPLASNLCRLLEGYLATTTNVSDKDTPTCQIRCQIRTCFGGGLENRLAIRCYLKRSYGILKTPLSGPRRLHFEPLCESSQSGFFIAMQPPFTGDRS